MIRLFSLTKLKQWLNVQDKKRLTISGEKFNVFDNTNPINQVTKRKLVGIVIDQHLLLADHVAYLIKRLSKFVFHLSQMEKTLDEQSPKAFYYGNVQSHLDYCSRVWGKNALSTSKRLYSSQNVLPDVSFIAQ